MRRLIAHETLAAPHIGNDTQVTLPIVVLISGTGSNLRAVHQAIVSGQCDARICAVVSDRRSAGGLSYASEHGLPTRVVLMRDFQDRAAWDHALAEVVASYKPRLVVLAGFMRIVSPSFVTRFPNEIINVHPALLPSFPGASGPEHAIEAGVRLSGCTVHIVDQGVDTGPILAQAAVRVLPSDDAKSLHTRIQKAEHQLLPQVIDAIARGQIELGDPPRLRHDVTSDEAIFPSIPPDS